MKEVIWMGDSLKSLKGFSEEVQKAIGYALHFAQKGEMHQSAKPLKGFGSGIFEIVDDDKSGTYRSVYAVQIDENLYVLHTFQKKSKSGIATPQKELNLIYQRLKMARELSKSKSKFYMELV